MVTLPLLVNKVECGVTASVAARVGNRYLSSGEAFVRGACLMVAEIRPASRREGSRCVLVVSVSHRTRVVRALEESKTHRGGVSWTRGCFLGH
jgi:hypothetical protein